MQRKGSLSGKMFAWCILQRRFAGHFEYMGSKSCQNQLILDAWRRYLAAKGRFPVRGSFGNALGRYFARNAALRLVGVRFEGVSFEGCAFVCPK